eukprot:GHVT01010226.1.p1 GENE.GHVT01010226.1~~GHVT01010226.1.p1  ORF type:complete len:134 (+),score=33.01 GHVT01010226.1:433-834(+)
MAPSGTWADARRSRASAAAAEASQNERDQAALAARSRWMERWAGETQEGAQRLAPRSPHGKPNAATHTQLDESWLLQRQEELRLLLAKENEVYSSELIALGYSVTDEGRRLTASKKEAARPSLGPPGCGRWHY